MTREEAIPVFKAFMENPLFSEVHKAAFNIAIHDIKAYHDWNINNLILVNKDNYELIRPKGHWIDNMDLGYHVSICSNCEWRGHGDTNLMYRPKYCPNCGAEMREIV